jgi:hypothetical protein
MRRAMDSCTTFLGWHRVIKGLARGIERLTHCLRGGLVKHATRKEWKNGRHANAFSAKTKAAIQS